jgi:hypothetical protein
VAVRTEEGSSSQRVGALLMLYLSVIFCRYIFNTEGHFLPMSPEISLPAEHCTHAGSSCKERVAERLLFAKRKLKKELEDSRRNEEVGIDQCSLSDLDSQTCSNNEERGTRDGDWTVSAESHLKVRIIFIYITSASVQFMQ